METPCAEALPSFFISVLVVLFCDARAASSTIRIFYSGPETNSVHTALTLAPKGTFTFVTDPAQADVFVLNGSIPDPAAVAARLNAGAGLLLILGPDLTAQTVQTAIGVPLTLEPRNDAVSLTNLPLNDPLIKQIIWNGAPQVRERSNIVTPMSSVQPLVTAYEDGEWVLWSAQGGKAFIFNAFLTNGFKSADPGMGLLQLPDLPPGFARRRADAALVCRLPRFPLSHILLNVISSWGLWGWCW